MKVQSSENKLVITEEFIFDQNKLPSDPNNHFKSPKTLLNPPVNDKIQGLFKAFEQGCGNSKISTCPRTSKWP